MKKPTPTKIVVITGGGRGIGAACALQFAKKGCFVAIASRTEAQINSVADQIRSEYGDLVSSRCGDVADETFVLSWFEEITEKWGIPSVLVNNAATLELGEFREMSADTWDRIIATNLRGPFLCSREFFRGSKKITKPEPRLILNISSLSGLPHYEKFPGMTPYIVSKFGVTGLTEALAVEGKALGISVVGIAPGAVDTQMLRKAAPQFKAGATPQDIAQFVVELAHSPAVAMLSGSTIPMDTNV